LNSILLRENYSWKKSFTFKPPHKSFLSASSIDTEKKTETDSLKNVTQNLPKDLPTAAQSTLSSFTTLASPNKRQTKKQKEALAQQLQQQQQQQLQQKSETKLPPSEATTDAAHLSLPKKKQPLDLNQIDEKLRRKKTWRIRNRRSVSQRTTSRDDSVAARNVRSKVFVSILERARILRHLLFVGQTI
jgi:type II secretory pathway pseudopilin PulG